MKVFGFSCFISKVGEMFLPSSSTASRSKCWDTAATLALPISPQKDEANGQRFLALKFLCKLLSEDVYFL